MQIRALIATEPVFKEYRRKNRDGSLVKEPDDLMVKTLKIKLGIGGKYQKYSRRDLKTVDVCLITHVNHHSKHQ